jgi:hypothetical protein
MLSRRLSGGTARWPQLINVLHAAQAMLDLMEGRRRNA